jgi:hypothetical protein
MSRVKEFLLFVPVGLVLTWFGLWIVVMCSALEEYKSAENQPGCQMVLGQDRYIQNAKQDERCNEKGGVAVDTNVGRSCLFPPAPKLEP